MPRGPEWIVILVIVLVIFGGAKLPSLTKNIAQSLKIFRTEMKNDGKSNTKNAEDKESSDK